MRVLFLLHNHPALQPGGTEAFAHGLFRTLKDRFRLGGLFLAAVSPLLRARKPGTPLQAAGAAPDEMLAVLEGFDRFFLSQSDAQGLAALAPVVAELDPDVVHLHHPLHLGIEVLDLLRRAAPRAAVVATLHDYFLICPREGQLLTGEGRLCAGPTPDACRRCLPERPALDFALRDLAIRDAFRRVDRLIAPSRFLRDRFVAAGWDAGRFTVLPNGVAAAVPAPFRESRDGRRDRFAVFGNVNRFKGTLVALGASARLSADGVAHRLAIHGGTAWQSDAFLGELAAALAAAPAAQHRGPYAAGELARRMAETDWVVVPSIWWENAPLVILEAFRHGRPVICGEVGGMAELVRDGVDGLHAPVNDPAGLAEVLRRAAEEPGLWDRLAARIVPPPDLEDVALRHVDLYREAIAARPPRRVRPPAQAQRRTRDVGRARPQPVER